MEIKEKKMFIGKHSFCAQFHTKTGDSFLKKVKYYQYFATNVLHVKNVIFFGVFGRKTGRAGPIILKLSTKRNQVF